MLCMCTHTTGLMLNSHFAPSVYMWLSSGSTAAAAPREQQAAGLSGCRALRDGRDDNVCPLGDWQAIEGEIGEQNSLTEKSRKRQESAEVTEVAAYDVI